MSPRGSQLLKRLPFLAVVAVGLIIWKTGYMPKSRTLVWELPPDASIRGVEVQLYEGDKLLKREELFYPSGPPDRIEEHLKLGRGDYLARFLIRRDGKPLESSQIDIHLGNEDVVERAIH